MHWIQIIDFKRDVLNAKVVCFAASFWAFLIIPSGTFDSDESYLLLNTIIVRDNIQYF